MNLRKIAISLILSAGAFGFTASAEAPNPMKEALMKAYQALLDEDPHDAETLFRRANEYYLRNDYIKALDDINNALKYLPEEDLDTRFQAIQLRANINMMLHRYEQAIGDLNSEISLDPQNYVAVYQRGTAFYELGRYPEAKTDFRLLQQRNPRSQEALFGLARVAVKENNLGLADELCDQAVELSPSNSQVYLRRASVRTLAGNEQGAVDDYILAISTDQENTPRALRELVEISKTNYPVVIAGLSTAIRQAPRNGMYYFIRAMIAQGHCNYLAAIADYDRIINENLDSYPGLNAALAECYFALGKFDTALLNIDYAISATRDNERYYVIKSQIQRALGNYDSALSCAETALEKEPDSNEALIAKALAQLRLGNSADASVCLSEATMNAPENPYLAIIRGWVLKDYRRQKKNADMSFERVLDMDLAHDQIKSYRGFALLQLDRKEEADCWIERVLAITDDYDGEVNYLAACYYAQAGNSDKAFKCMAASLEKGYANYYNWAVNTEADVNVEPIRKDPRFSALLKANGAIFGR